MVEKVSVWSLDAVGFTTGNVDWEYVVYEEQWVICNFSNTVAVAHQWELSNKCFFHSVSTLVLIFQHDELCVCPSSPRFPEL